ncbi:MAG: hypothetical protein ACYSWR_05920, partial [Planctomycetota bacterium]
MGQRFYEIAYELANSEHVTEQQVEQAIIFLSATMKLDSRGKYAHPILIRLATQESTRDYSKLVAELLTSYVDEAADLEVITEAIAYLLEQSNSREEREKTLEQMLRSLGGKNEVVGSELASLLGVLMAEKADLKTAQSLLMQAYKANEYNRLAFTKLTELVGEQIHPAAYLEQLRLRLRENPLDMEAAMEFAEYAERLGLYETATGAYEYCGSLFRFLHPSEVLPRYVYLPWTISSYNTQRSQHKCLQLASDLRHNGGFDLFLEAVAGKAAAKIGNQLQANQILKAAEDKALELAVG